MGQLSFIVHDKIHKKTMVVVFDAPMVNPIVKIEQKVEVYGEV